LSRRADRRSGLYMAVATPRATCQSRPRFGNSRSLDCGFLRLSRRDRP
jgi:hypothetical protein